MISICIAKKYKKKKDSCSFYMWYVLCSTGNIDFGGYPIALEAFSNTSNFKIDWRASWSPIKGAEWGTFLQCLAHRSPLSIRQCRTPNKCPSTSAVSHCRSLEHMSDNLTGAMKCLHQIINAFIDRSQRVLREHFCTPRICYRDEIHLSLVLLKLNGIFY